MSDIKKEKKRKIDFVNPLSLVGIESRKTKFIVILMCFLFVLFSITAFMRTVQGDNSLGWWILACVAAMVMIAVAMFSKKPQK